MGVRVGSRFSDRRYPDEERVCPHCKLPKLHQKVRETQIAILAGMPLFVYRDKMVFDCNHCRTKTETNVPMSVGPRPLPERFGLLMAIGVISVLYGAYATIDGGIDAIARRSRTAEEKKRTDEFLATWISHESKLKDTLRAFLEGCEREAGSPKEEDKRLSDSNTFAQVLHLAADPGFYKGATLYCARFSGTASSRDNIDHGSLHNRPPASTEVSKIVVLPPKGRRGPLELYDDRSRYDAALSFDSSEAFGTAFVRVLESQDLADKRMWMKEYLPVERRIP